MLRLTLRSRDDARFLARIIERDGTAFVLDYGDPTLVADASERVARGFSIFRDGKVETVSPQAPDILPLLAEFYAQEGLVVSLEEPSYGAHPSLDRTPLELAPMPDVGDDTELSDDPTELVDATATFSDDDSADLSMWVGPAQTNRGALKKRALWRPEPAPKTGPMPLEPLEPVGVVAELDEDEEETEQVPDELLRVALAEAETELHFDLDELELDGDAG